MLVIRGELLKKYPTAVIYAHRAAVAPATNGHPDPSQERTLADLTPAEEADPPHDEGPDAAVRRQGRAGHLLLRLRPHRGGGARRDRRAPATTTPAGSSSSRSARATRGSASTSSATGRCRCGTTWPGRTCCRPRRGRAPAYIRFDAATPTLTLTAPTDPADAEKVDQFAEDRALTWNAQLNSADLAYILYQSPVLVAVHAREMLRDA